MTQQNIVVWFDGSYTQGSRFLASQAGLAVTPAKVDLLQANLLIARYCPAH